MSDEIPNITAILLREIRDDGRATRAEVADLKMICLGTFERTERLDRRFGELDRRFVDLERRFGELHLRFVDLERRFGELHLRFEDVRDDLATMIKAEIMGATTLFQREVEKRIEALEQSRE